MNAFEHWFYIICVFVLMCFFITVTAVNWDKRKQHEWMLTIGVNMLNILLDCVIIASESVNILELYLAA